MRRGGIQVSLQGPFLANVALAAGKIADRIGEVACQDLPQPGRLCRGVAAAERLPRLVRLQQRLLHNVRGIQLSAQFTVDLHPSHEQQVAAKAFDFQERSSLAWSATLLGTVELPAKRLLSWTLFQNRARRADGALRSVLESRL